MNSRPIGIFDSGVGGLTVCKAVRKVLPGEDIIYFGDTMRFPYGTRSHDTVIRYSKEIVNYFLSRDVKMIICACNTASAVALPVLEKENSIPVMGVIQAGVRAACKRIKSGKIGVIGTRATINSKAYVDSIHRVLPDVEVIQQQATIFVSLAEEGWHCDDIAKLAVKKYLQQMYTNDVRTLILGCTHFPLLKKTIKDVYPDLDTVDTGHEIALDVKAILEEKNLANNQLNGNIELYASDITETIARLKEIFFGKNSTSLKLLKIREII